MSQAPRDRSHLSMFGTLARVNFAHLNFNEARKGLRSNPLKDCVTPGSLRCFQLARLDNNLADLFADFDPFLHRRGTPCVRHCQLCR